MAPSTLGQLVLGYQMVWDRARRPVALQLFVAAVGDEPVEGAHFLRTVEQTWSEQCPTLILTPASAPLMVDFLRHGKPGGPWLSVQQDLLDDAALRELVHRAHARGLTLLWRGEPGQRPEPAIAGCFARSIVTLTTAESLRAAHVALRQQKAEVNAGNGLDSPVHGSQIVEAVASRLIADHCLDQRAAFGVAGWPADDVLLSHRHQPIQPSHRTIGALIDATDADVALELIEHTLADEPLLAYRFLRYTNSAALGLRTGVESLRHGLMLLGLSRFKAWLLEQMALASNEPDLDPIRLAMVMRARLTEHLLEAGEEDNLRREMFLCGVLSQIDGLLGEPLKDALQRLPLSDRVVGAILSNSGPYAPYLELATALEYPHMASVPGICDTHGIDLAEVNRTFLRTLTQIHRPSG